MSKDIATNMCDIVYSMVANVITTQHHSLFTINLIANLFEENS